MVKKAKLAIKKSKIYKNFHIKYKNLHHIKDFNKTGSENNNINIASNNNIIFNMKERLILKNLNKNKKDKKQKNIDILKENENLNNMINSNYSMDEENSKDNIINTPSFYEQKK